MHNKEVDPEVVKASVMLAYQRVSNFRYHLPDGKFSHPSEEFALMYAASEMGEAFGEMMRLVSPNDARRVIRDSELEKELSDWLLMMASALPEGMDIAFHIPNHSHVGPVRALRYLSNALDSVIYGSASPHGNIVYAMYHIAGLFESGDSVMDETAETLEKWWKRNSVEADDRVRALCMPWQNLVPTPLEVGS